MKIAWFHTAMEQIEHVLFTQFIYHDFIMFLTTDKDHFAFVEIMGTHVCLLDSSPPKLFYAENVFFPK